MNKTFNTNTDALLLIKTIKTMNFIRRILKPATTASTTKLGRWQLHYDPKIVDSKVDQANEDHCGCCHESAHQKPEAKMAPKTTALHVNNAN